MKATDRIPAELVARHQWVVWRQESRGGKPTKVLYQARHPARKAKVNDTKTWATFEQAKLAAKLHGFDGIGYVFSDDDPYVGIDLDRCLREDGEVEPWARPHVTSLGKTYGEVSPSGRGIKFIARGELPGSGKRRNGYGADGYGAVEIYDRGRFFTITGDIWDDQAGRIADLSDVVSAIYVEVQERPSRAATTFPQPPAGRAGGGSKADPLARASAYLARMDPAVSGNRGHDQTFKAACKLVEFGLDEAAVYRLLWEEYNPRCVPPWSEAELRHKVEHAFRENGDRRGAKLRENRNGHSGGNGTGGPVEGPRAGGGERHDRPEIIITTEEHEVIDRAVGAIASEPSVFQRCNVLVTVYRDISTRRRYEPERPPGTPRIVPLPSPRLRDLLTKRARWVKLRKARNGGDEPVPAHPPDWAVAGVAARGEWAEIRPIEGIVEAPTLRPDGSILDTPGWDEHSGLLYEPNAAFPPIPARPSRDNAVEAADAILDLVAEFPFVDESHRAAWLAALLTPLARFAIRGPCPLFMFDANTPGSGKSKLADLISILATGRESVTSDYPSKEEEMVKTLLSIALAADRIVVFDNVSTGFSIGGRSLDRVLTTGMTKGRFLGRLEMTPDLPVHTVFYATGNNIGLKGDAIRRVVPCRLESDHERPEERKGFKYPDILKHARLKRPDLVTSALTILRAYIVAGRPDPDLIPMDYPAWAGLIRNAVHWVTGADPCSPRRALRESDPETNARFALVHGWAELPGAERGLTVAEAVKLLTDNPADFRLLRDTLLERSRKDELPSRGSIGMLLKATKGRVVEGLAIQSVDAGLNTNAWKVVTTGNGTSGTNGTLRGASARNGADNCNTEIGSQGRGKSHQSHQSHGSWSAAGYEDTPF